MLSSVLNSKQAVYMNIFIMRAFVRLREILTSHKDLARAIEDMSRRQDEQGEITAIIETINQLLLPEPVPPKRQSWSILMRRAGKSKLPVCCPRELFPWPAEAERKHWAGGVYTYLDDFAFQSSRLTIPTSGWPTIWTQLVNALPLLAIYSVAWQCRGCPSLSVTAASCTRTHWPATHHRSPPHAPLSTADRGPYV